MLNYLLEYLDVTNMLKHFNIKMFNLLFKIYSNADSNFIQ